MRKPSIRTAQLISPFGPGALCEVDGQSFFIRGTGSWRKQGNLEDIQLPALTDRMRPGMELKRPIHGVSVSRFPRWHFCTSCREMVYWSHERDKTDSPGDPLPVPTCSKTACREQRLVPMRFVALCDGGHMEEIDWYFWTHRRQQKAQHGQCARNVAKLSFVVTGESGGDFSSMEIRCNCGSRATLEGISDGPLPQKCEGRQPGEQAQGCLNPADPQRRPHPLVMEPRGSSALHYASVISALDIAADTSETGNAAMLKADSVFASLVDVAASLPAGLESTLTDPVAKIAERLAIDTGLAIKVFTAEVMRRRAPVESGGDLPADVSQGEILDEEFPILASSTPIDGRWLKTRPAPPGGRYGLDQLFEKVVQVERLREVRAFRGFKRRKPGDEAASITPSLNRPSPIWLPATQVLGEGIFVEFSKPALQAWLKTNQVEITAFTEQQLRAAERAGLPMRMGFEANPVFVMVHTFAHLLVNQLSFDCGYSSTSLRERIYCGPLHNLYAGVLVYTADSDSEGSMGGLVELGSPGRFAEVTYRAVSRSEWCSGDPVCRELEAQGLDGLNRAACHACSLVAETSCTCSNVLLDRVLVSGRGKENGRGVREPLGFFQSILAA